MKQLNLGLLFGGQSVEHEVSVQSAINLYEALDCAKFIPHLIYIDKQGVWHSIKNFDDLNKSNPIQLIDHLKSLDVILPILHGSHGENGSLQGLFEVFNIPYVGCKVLSSAICTDKDITKKLLKETGIKVVDSVTLRRNQVFDIDAITKQLGSSLFVKPANLGSSVGVLKVQTKADLKKAITEAFLYSPKILVEKAIEGYEIECAVIGGGSPTASPIGKLIYDREFYDYEAKYSPDNKTILEIPAQIPEAIAQKAQQISLKTFEVLECTGLARVDMFLTNTGEILVNEVNTMPGFTKFSMFPLLWQKSGMSFTKLITHLIELTVEDFDAKS